MVTPDESTLLTDAEVRALNALDEAAVANHLLELLAVPSVTGADAESALQHRLAERMRELDLDVDLWPMDLSTLQAHPDFPCMEAPRGEAWGVVGHSPATHGPTRISCKATSTWCRRATGRSGPATRSRPGWSGRDTRARGLRHEGRPGRDPRRGGRGAGQPGAAARSPGRALPGQRGGRRSRCLRTLHRGHTGDACIIAEPTGGTIISANAGALTFRIEVPGLATHGSTRYAGVSAIDAFLPIYRELSELERRRNGDDEPLMADWPVPYPISIGTVWSPDRDYRRHDEAAPLKYRKPV